LIGVGFGTGFNSTEDVCEVVFIAVVWLELLFFIFSFICIRVML